MWNKKEQKLIDKFNKPETVVFLSSYPEEGGESAVRNAIANYTRELAVTMAKKKLVVVIAEVIDKPCVYEENSVLVMRCYKRNSLFLVWQVTRALRSLSEAKQVLNQFEFGVYGGSMVTFSLSLLGYIVRAIGKKYLIMMHQVPDNLGDLSEHLGVAKKSLKTSVYNAGMKMFYLLSGLGSDCVLVHNRYLKTRLAKYVKKEKIGVVAHGVSKVKKIRKAKARKMLGIGAKEKMILVFGYLSWYKGSDWVVEQIGKLQQKYPKQKMKLVLAGGPSGTLKNMSHYQRYVEELMNEAKRLEVEVTGYVCDSDKSMYFSAADLIVLPHRVAMSESGVMAHVMAYGKPYLLSEARATSLGLTSTNPQVFEIGNVRGFEKKLLKVLGNKKLSNKLAREITVLGRERSWSKIAKQYLTQSSGKRELAYTGVKYVEVLV